MKGRARKLGIAARRRLAELPRDDGKIPILGTAPFGGVRWLLADPEDVHRHFAMTMAQHDRRSEEERWGGNQWGEEWVAKLATRPLFAKRMPLLLSDLTLAAWSQVLREINSTSATPRRPSTTWKDGVIQSLSRITGSRPRTSANQARKTS